MIRFSTVRPSRTRALTPARSVVLFAMAASRIRSAKATKAETVASSYHVSVELKNAESGKDVSDATASLMTVSPTNKDATLELKSMMNKFSGNLNFSEKGEYKLTLNINSGGATNATPFKYTVQ